MKKYAVCACILACIICCFPACHDDVLEEESEPGLFSEGMISETSQETTEHEVPSDNEEEESVLQDEPAEVEESAPAPRQAERREPAPSPVIEEAETEPAVEAPPTEPLSLSFDDEEISIPMDTIHELNVTVEPEGREDITILWSSEDSDIAGVDQEGVVRTNSPGTVVISAQIDGTETKASIRLIVTEPPNTPPSKPQNLSVRYVLRGGRYKALCTWDRSTDSENDHVSYLLYRKVNGSYEEAARTSETSAEVEGLKKQDSFKLVARDDRGEQSEEVFSGEPPLLYVRVSGGVYFPLGEVRDIATMGVSLYCDLLYPDLFVPGLDAGGRIGYITMVSKPDATDYSRIVPFLGTLSYRYGIAPGFDLLPSLSLGGSYNSLSYIDDYGETVNSSFFLPHFEGGVTGEYFLTDSFTLNAGCSYTGMIDAGSLVSGIGINAGIAYRFR